MPLAPLQKLLADARKGGYALGYFESWNLESFQAVMQAAEEERAPVIAGFNGGFLCHQGRRAPESLAFYAGLRLALERSAVSVGFLFNESGDLQQIKQAMDLGFNAIMPESENMEPDRYLRLVQDVVKIAHPKGIAVEAQVGRLPHGADGAGANGRPTDPNEASRFVRETNIDALAVAAGNVHILTEGKAGVDFDVLRRIRDRVDIPLVLHGGTGIELDQAGRMIELGVVKFNFGTILKQAYLQAVRDKLAAYRAPMSPHPFLGMGGEQDIMVAGRDAVKETVKGLLRKLRSSNQEDP